MLKHFRPALIMVIAFTLLTGVAYPLGMMLLAQAAFPAQANGSPITRNGMVVGSKLIGQGFSRPGYFWGRPSAAGKGYDARSSSGSNLGPSSKALVDRITADARRFGAPISEIPPDLLLASGSGLDPDISPAAARFQVARVAAARHLPAATVACLVDAAVVGPSLGLVGEPHVNVLELNLALDALGSAPAQ